MPEEIILSGPNSSKEKLQQIFGSSSQRPWIILTFFLFFLILTLVGFNLALDRYGKFWEGKEVIFSPPVSEKQVVKERGEIARENIERFLKGRLKGEYFPQKLEVKHRMTSYGKTTGTDYTYGAWWQIGEVGFYSSLHFNSDGSSNIDGLDLLVGTPQATENLDSASGKDAISKYFKINNENFNCVARTKSVECEYFKKGEDGRKRGIGVTSPAGSLRGDLFFACEVFPTSENYWWTSCLGDLKER